MEKLSTTDIFNLKMLAFDILGLNHENMSEDKSNSALSACMKQKYGIGFEEYCKLMLDIHNHLVD